MSDFKLAPINALHNKALASDKMVMLLTQGPVNPDDVAEVGEALRTAGGVVANPDSSVVVSSFGTDSERGESLAAAYAAAKLLTPNGDVLSAANRAQVILPPGKYKLSSTLTMDTNFVDIVALVPEMGGERQATDFDNLMGYVEGETLIDLGTFRPPSTLVYSETPGTVILQTCGDVRLTGFGIAQLGTWAPLYETSDPVASHVEEHMFKIGDVANDASIYRMMYFWSGSIDDFTWPVSAHGDFAGTWIDCIANGWSYRVGSIGWAANPGEGTSTSVEFRATMIRCQGGSRSFVGDYYPGTTSRKVIGAKFHECKAIGTTNEIGDLNESDSGYASFSGCFLFACDIESDSVFTECEAGPKSFGLGAVNAGTFIRCRSGSNSFGAAVVSDHQAIFSGYAEDCVAGADSFGGHTSDMDASNAGTYCSGSLVRCTTTGNTRPLNLLGASIRDSRITNTTTGQHGVVLLDSSSSISNTDIIVLQGGTGIPVNAASAKSAAVYGCRMNNATNDADGLGANVTNLVSSAGNIVSNSVT